jgi:DNA adenine methylase
VKAVINDLDPDLIEAHKIIKSNPSLAGISKYENLTPEQIEHLVNVKRPTDKLGKLARYTAYTSGTFSGNIKMRKDGTYNLYKFPDISKKLRRIPETAEYMKNTTVLNQDYKSVIKKYDRPDAFIYLDPPYENSDRLYEFPDVDYEEMARVLEKVKGKFLMSINDSPNIRKIFKKFYIHKVVVRGGGGEKKEGQRKTTGSGKRNELFISNY